MTRARKRAEKPEILWTTDLNLPGDTVMIQGHAFTEDVIVKAAPTASASWQTLTILDEPFDLEPGEDLSGTMKLSANADNHRFYDLSFE